MTNTTHIGGSEDGLITESSSVTSVGGQGGRNNKSMQQRVGAVVLGTTLAFGAMDTEARNGASGKIVDDASLIPQTNSQTIVVSSPKNSVTTPRVSVTVKKPKAKKPGVRTQTKKPTVSTQRSPRVIGNTPTAKKSVIGLGVTPDLPDTKLVISPEQKEMERLQNLYLEKSQQSYSDLRILLRSRQDYIPLLKMAKEQGNKEFVIRLQALAYDRVAVSERTYSFYGTEQTEIEFDSLLNTNFERAEMIASLVIDQSRRDLFSRKIATVNEANRAEKERLVRLFEKPEITTIPASVSVSENEAVIAAPTKVTGVPTTPTTNDIVSLTPKVPAPVEVVTVPAAKVSIEPIAEVPEVAVPTVITPTIQVDSPIKAVVPETSKASISEVSLTPQAIVSSKVTPEVPKEVVIPEAETPKAAVSVPGASLVVPPIAPTSVPVVPKVVTLSAPVVSAPVVSAPVVSAPVLTPTTPVPPTLVTADTKISATEFQFNPQEVLDQKDENLKFLKKIPPRSPLLASEGSAQIDTLNLTLNRKIVVLTELAMNIDTTFKGTAVENFGFEQRVAMLAHAIVTSRKIEALDMAMITLAEIVSSRQSAALDDKRTIDDAKSVINFLHAMLLTAGQGIFADQIDLLSNSKLGEVRQKEVCTKLPTREKQILCYKILNGSALMDDPKMAIGNIARNVDDSVYNKFTLIYPAIEDLSEYKKSKK